MAYSTPLTAVSNTALTAAQWNASVRDNILVTPAALATAASRFFVTTGPNAIAERAPSHHTIATSSTTTSTSYGNLISGAAGPTVTVTTGALAFVWLCVSMSNNIAGNSVRADFTVSGATTRAASDSTAAIHEVAANNQGYRGTAFTPIVLTPGSNVFTAVYRVTGATTGTFNDRTMAVIPW